MFYAAKINDMIADNLQRRQHKLADANVKSHVENQ